MKLGRWLAMLVTALAVSALLLPGSSAAQNATRPDAPESDIEEVEPGELFNPAFAPPVATETVEEERSQPRGYEFSLRELRRLKRESAAGAFSQGAGTPTRDGGPTVQTPPTLLASYPGFTYTGWIPPDPTIAVGPSDMVHAVNESFRISNKTGGTIFTTTLASWFSNVLTPTGYSQFDPWVIYDVLSSRFYILALAINTTAKTSYFLLSVSDNNTASGNWCNWKINAQNGSTETNVRWADYEKLGNTSNALIFTSNIFNFSGGAFVYAKVNVIPKSAALNTNCPGFTYRSFRNIKRADGSTAFTIQPAWSFISNSNVSYLLNSYSGTGSVLNKWTITTTDPANPTMATSSISAASTISVSNYSAPNDATQKGSAVRVDTGDARLLNLMYRGSGLWASQTTGCTLSGNSDHSCLRWYNLTAGGSVTQSGTFGASGYFYYYPNIAADASGNAVISFARSGSVEYVSFRYAGHKTSDPLGSLGTSAQLKAGQGCYTRYDSLGRNRWGDYAGTAPDPSTAKVFWIYHEYVSGISATCSSNTWRTQIGKVTH